MLSYPASYADNCSLLLRLAHLHLRLEWVFPVLTELGLLFQSQSVRRMGDRGSKFSEQVAMLEVVFKFSE